MQISRSPAQARRNILSEAASCQLPYRYTKARKNLASTPFKDSTISVAVDVSTSTRGLILSQEALAISKIYHQLSKEARKNGHVLPWSNTAHPVLRLTDSAKLRPSFGTDPSVLCSDVAHSSSLKESELWFLMTDGMIDEENIKKFAESIARSGLHGITCVIILFGYLTYRPMLLNTSVGLSLFAVVPNCLFLFHDVKSGTIYVLQHKGCFTTNFESVWSNNSHLDHTATWDSLSQTTYEQLAMLQIPKPAKLGEDDIALAGGEIINIQDLYQGRVDPQIVSQIFEIDDNMKTVLLTAITRGKNAEIEAWLAEQRVTGSDYYTAPRPDDHKACFYSKELISLMKAKHSRLDKLTMRIRLQTAHKGNWDALQDSIARRLAETGKHNRIVEDSTDRLGLTRSMPLSTPSMLSPICGGPDIMETTQYSSDQPYLYTPNYHRKPVDEKEIDPHGYCRLCGVDSSPLALLLKKLDPNLQTRDLPPPGSRARLAFPLAMGNFSETDIISTFVCCDPCSYSITLIGEAPANEKIVGAIILTNFVENEHLWKSAVDIALEQRFAQEDLDLLFLAILYTTLQNIECEQAEPTIREALSWAISQLQRAARAPMSLSQSLAAPGEEVIYLYFVTVLENSFLGESMPKAPILRYPIEGFAVLVRAAQNMKNLEQRQIDNVVLERFLFHLTEQFIALRMVGSPTNPASFSKSLGSKLIAEFLPTITNLQVQNGQENQCTIATPVTVASLRGGSLLSKEAFAIFQNMIPSFHRLEESGARYIDQFVREMLQVPKEINDSVKSFELIRKRLDSQPMSHGLAR